MNRENIFQRYLHARLLSIHSTVKLSLGFKNDTCSLLYSNHSDLLLAYKTKEFKTISFRCPKFDFH